MGDILGLTLSHFPYLRLKHYHLAGVLTGNMGRGWADKPHLKDPANWPEQMRQEWGGDQGAAVSKAAQEHQFEQFRKVRAALDDFQPDVIVI
ncbi:MAG TPA: extradiol ring-cleavage dioxygenase, partial [Chloroflexota bacterium]